MNYVALGAAAWLCFIFFGTGFACSRIHDSERVQRVIGEHREWKEKYRKLVLEHELLLNPMLEKKLR